MTDQSPVAGMPLRPAQYTERLLITKILDGTYPPGSDLPAERGLAETLGVTRPTVREALQRLAAEGWVTIRHGRATRVNNYWETGGLALLGTLAKYRDLVPGELILSLLDFRMLVLPPVARYAAERAPGQIRDFLQQRRELASEASAFTAFDWQLQTLMAKMSGNPIYPMLFNDFRTLFQTMGAFYFRHDKARKASMSYYDALYKALRNGGNAAERVVRQAMEESAAIWKQINPSTRETTHETMERLGG